MGLYDHLRVEFRHPEIPPGEIYQTSDTPFHHLGHYTITAQGRLLEHNTALGPLVGDVELLWDGPLYFLTTRPQYGPPSPAKPQAPLDEAYLKSIGARFFSRRPPRKNRPGSEIWALPVRTSHPESLPNVCVWYRADFIKGQLASLELVRSDQVVPPPIGPFGRTFRYRKDNQVFAAVFNEHGALVCVEALSA